MGDSITYEELFELLRRERNSEELQVLQNSFYTILVAYLKDKESVINDKSDEAMLFGTSERDKIKIQLENAKKIARELVHRREKKIIILALNKTRTDSDIIDTSSLLTVEEEFFHGAVELLSSYRKGVLESILSMKKPVYGNSEQREALRQTIKNEIEEERTQVPSKQTEISSGLKIIKFTGKIPKFMGSDEKVYGPYDENDTAELEEAIANILINKGKAVDQS